MLKLHHVGLLMVAGVELLIGGTGTSATILLHREVLDGTGQLRIHETKCWRNRPGKTKKMTLIKHMTYVTAYDAHTNWQLLKRGCMVILDVFRLATLDALVDFQWFIWQKKLFPAYSLWNYLLTLRIIEGLEHLRTSSDGLPTPWMQPSGPWPLTTFR